MADHQETLNENLALVRTRSAVRGVLALQVTANGVGVVIVTLYLRFLSITNDDPLASTSLNLWVFGIYLAAMFTVGLPINVALLRRAVRWIREQREPSPRERKVLFTLPTLETLTALASWFVAAVLFGVINKDATQIAVGIALAGVTTCTLLYLLMEGHFRPLYALRARRSGSARGTKRRGATAHVGMAPRKRRTAVSDRSREHVEPQPLRPGSARLVGAYIACRRRNGDGARRSLGDPPHRTDSQRPATGRRR